MTVIPVTMRAPNDFKFEEPEGRPFRTVSIETEMDGSGTQLAKKLFSCGLIGTDYVMDYGRHPGDQHPHIAFLKYDGSVSAGELVFDRINLTDPNHAALLNESLAEIRGLEKASHVLFAPNCGGHIHIDAKGYGVYDAIRLSQGYGFIEEVICRLAGSGKTYGHRSLYKGFDAANMGRGYCNPITKLGEDIADVAWNKLMSQDRMSGVNFKHFVGARCSKPGHMIPLKENEALDFDAIRNAPLTNADIRSIESFVRSERSYFREQGRDFTEAQETALRMDLETNLRNQRVARVQGVRRGDPPDKKPCTCNLKMNTIEWRVWNSQGNPRILYAWIAVMQALHAWAWRPGHVELYRAIEPMPAFGWTAKPYPSLSEDEINLSKDRVAWMFAELPLTAEEKDALAYSFMRTPYKNWGGPFFRERAKEPYKRPQYINHYARVSRSIPAKSPSQEPLPQFVGAPRNHAQNR